MPGVAARGGVPQVVIDLALPRDVAPVETWTQPLPSVTPHRPRGARPASRGTGRPAAGGPRRRPRHRRGRRLPDPPAGEVRGSDGRRAACPGRSLSSRPSWTASTSACPSSTRRRAPRSDTRCTASSRSCSTPRRRGSRSSPSRAPGADYAAALRELFDLEPKDVANVSSPPKRGAPRPPCASAPDARPSPRPSRLGRRSAAREPATRSSSSRSRPRGRLRRAADGHRRDRRVRCGHPQGPARTVASTSPSTRSRTSRPLPSPDSSSPPCPCARTAGTCSWLATASPSESCRPDPSWAPARPGAPPSWRAGPRPRHPPDPRQRRHATSGSSRAVRSMRSSLPARAWLDSAGSTWSPRCSTRSRSCRRRVRGRSRSSAVPTGPTSGGRQHRSRTPTRGPVSPPSVRLLAALEAGCTAPVGALAEVVEGDDGLSCRSGPSPAARTAESSCAARSPVGMTNLR